MHFLLTEIKNTSVVNFIMFRFSAQVIARKLFSLVFFRARWYDKQIWKYRSFIAVDGLLAVPGRGTAGGKEMLLYEKLFAEAS